MHLEKIEIPAFRVLRDVVLEFDEAYDPQIFPIGSENGGGKSTLLQLIFVLLHCSTSSRRSYLENLLASNFQSSYSAEHIVARLTIRSDKQHRSLEYVSLSDDFLLQHLPEPPNAGFKSKAALLATARAINERSEKIRKLQEQKDHLDRIIKSQDGKTLSDRLRQPREIEIDLERVEHERDRLLSEQERLQAHHEVLVGDTERLNGLLVALNYHLITTYRCLTPIGQQEFALVVRCPDLNISQVKEFLQAAARKIFLIGPSIQQYLFLDLDTRKALLRATSNNSRAQTDAPQQNLRPQLEYLNKLDASESAMSGFYVYDWLSVDPLVRLFASARDEDFKAVVRTGDYGTSYTTLMKEVNGLLFGKRVQPLPDLTGIEFIVVSSTGQETRLNPEDLSQGEMKRLMIYAWLRASKISDAIVLMDEIETAFHPDWQVGIVRDLQDWAPTNQYLLATHSYELCQALTPRHVHELQPRLRRGSQSPDSVKPTGQAPDEVKPPE